MTKEARIKALELKVKELEDMVIQKNAKIAKLNELNTTDELTKVKNRRGFMELLNKAIAAARRDASKSFYLAILDIDHFKNINDTKGHPEGDRILREVAKICSMGIREEEIFGRIGGEEFAFILNAKTSEEAESVFKRIQKKLKLRENVKVSIGMVKSKVPQYKAGEEPAWLNNSPKDYVINQIKDFMLQEADSALYNAKKTRDTIVDFDSI